VPNFLKLGRREIEILRLLQLHGGWYPGCGWQWRFPCRMRPILENLAQRELVTKASIINGKGEMVPFYRAIPLKWSRGEPQIL